jgi:uncharacterized membrane protein SpoIIM required for sporulation
MIEMLINPKKAERKPWEMFFVGMLYATVSIILVMFLFSGDDILKNGSGLLIVLLTVIFCMPFMYYLIKEEEGKDLEINDEGKLVKEHSKALYALLWLFLGITVAFAIWYIILPSFSGQTFNYQIQTFCAINSPGNFNYCVESASTTTITGNATSLGSFFAILINNLRVLVMTLIFSLAFGAGAIFILVWNASVIGSAIGIFAKGRLFSLPAGLFRYMIHGIPEIAGYFLGALAGGILSVAVIRKDLQGEKKWRILEDVILLVIASIIILILAALMEVYLTPIFF